MVVAGCCGVARAESDKVVARLIDIVRVAVTVVRLWARVSCGTISEANLLLIERLRFRPLTTQTPPSSPASSSSEPSSSSSSYSLADGSGE